MAKDVIESTIKIDENVISLRNRCIIEESPIADIKR